MKRKKVRLKPVPVVITGIIVIGIVCLIIALTHNDGNKSKEDTKADVSINRTNLKQDMSQEESSKEETVVDILFENTAIPVGTSLKVTALVTPDDTDKALVWTSSDENIFTVDKEGIIVIKGVGTATLTATVGSVSDAVVIEGIPSVSSGSENGFVVYTGQTGAVSSNTASSGNGSGNNAGNASGSSDQGNGNDDTGGQSDGTQGNADNGAWQPQDGTGGTTGGDSGQNNGSDGGGRTSTDIGAALTSNGFEQTVSNVYVCQENGTYNGEIITQSNVTIIYIKQRSATFDSRIRSVIDSILPGNSSQVWSNYLSASTDRTFTIDGRVVRIVVATGGGHSQIVIYN